MANERWRQSVDEAGLEAILSAAAGQIDYPAEPDLSAVVRQRIERISASQSPASSGIGERSTADDPLVIAGGPIQQSTPWRWREIAMLAGGIAAAAILVIAVGMIFRGFGDDDTNTPAISPSPTPQPTATATVEASLPAPEIPGYQLVATAGKTTIPDQPIKVLQVSDDRYLVLEPVLGRLIAYNAGGEIDESWGDDGYSPHMTRPIDAAMGSDGAVYVISRSGQTVWVLDAQGSLTDTWETSKTEPQSPEDLGISSKIPRPAIAVTEGDVVNVALDNNEVLRYDADGNQLESLEIDPATLIDIDASDDGQLVALTRSEILRYDDGWQSISDINVNGNLIRLGTTPDGGYTVLYRPQPANSPSLTVFDSDGVEQRTLDSINAGDMTVLLGAFGIPTILPDGSMLVPDPARGQVTMLQPDGTASIWIAADDDPAHFRTLFGVAVDGQGTVRGLDFVDGSYVVRSFDKTGTLIDAKIASDLEVPTQPYSPYSETIHISAWPDGRFAIGMVGLNGIGVFAADGSLESTLRIQASPTGITFTAAFSTGPEGSLFVLGQNGNVVHYASDGSVIETLPTTDAGSPTAILYHDGHLWAAADGKVFSMEESASEWRTILDLPDPITNVAYGLAATPDGHLLVTALSAEQSGILSQKLLVFDPEGELRWDWPLIENASGNQFLDISVGPDGLLALSDLINGTIYLYQPSGSDLTPEQPVATQQPVDEPTPAATVSAEVEDVPVLAGYQPVGIAGEPVIPNAPVDAVVGPDGRMFVSDMSLNRVLAFTPDGELDTTWGFGGQSEQLVQPTKLAQTPDGDLLVADQGQIVRLNGDGSVDVLWVLPNGGSLGGLDVADNGRIAVTASTFEQVEKVFILSPAGEEIASATIQFVNIRGLTVAGDQIAVLVSNESAVNRGAIQVHSFTMDGEEAGIWPEGDTVSIGDFQRIAGIDTNPDGEIVVAGVDIPEEGMPNIELFSFGPDGQPIDSVTIHEVTTIWPQAFNLGFSIAPDGRLLFPDYLNQRVRIYSPEGEPLGEITGDIANGFGSLGRVEVGPDGSVYAIDQFSHRVLQFSPTGELQRRFASDIATRPGFPNAPTVLDDVTLLPDGRLAMAVNAGNQVGIFDPNGSLIAAWPDPPLVDFENDESVFNPYGIGTSSDGTIFITEQQSGGYIKKFTADGDYLGEWLAREDGGIPVIFDVADDQVYVAEEERIQIFDLDGNPIDEIPLDSQLFDISVTPDGTILGVQVTFNDPNLTSELIQVAPDGTATNLGELTVPAIGPTYIDAGPDGTLAISVSEARQVWVYRASQ